MCKEMAATLSKILKSLFLERYLLRVKVKHGIFDMIFDSNF